MATATKREVEKTRVVQEKYTERVFEVTLSEDEAFTLYVLLYRAGGARSGPRGMLDSIRGALATAGVQWDMKMAKADAKVSGYPIFPDSF